jgi:hypothetical protein
MEQAVAYLIILDEVDTHSPNTTTKHTSLRKTRVIASFDENHTKIGRAEECIFSYDESSAYRSEQPTLALLKGEAPYRDLIVVLP